MSYMIEFVELFTSYGTVLLASESSSYLEDYKRKKQNRIEDFSIISFNSILLLSNEQSPYKHHVTNIHEEVEDQPSLHTVIVGGPPASVVLLVKCRI